MKRNFFTSVNLRQTGAAVLEFALVVLVLFGLMIGIVEFGRVLYAMNVAAEATRFGARLAVVCDIADENNIIDRMKSLPGWLADYDIDIEYLPDGCIQSTCRWVTVKIENGELPLFMPIPIVPESITVPSFATTLPRESLQTVNAAGEINPVCP